MKKLFITLLLLPASLLSQVIEFNPSCQKSFSEDDVTTKNPQVISLYAKDNEDTKNFLKYLGRMGATTEFRDVAIKSNYQFMWDKLRENYPKINSVYYPVFIVGDSVVKDGSVKELKRIYNFPERATDKITIYGRDTCSRTAFLRLKLQEEGIGYYYKNIDQDPVHEVEMFRYVDERYGNVKSVSFPVVRYNNTTIMVPTIDEVKRMLNSPEEENEITSTENKTALPRSLDNLPSGAIQKGSMTNQILMRDASIGAFAEAGLQGCDKPEAFTPYLLQYPKGEPGSQTWLELWQVKGCNKVFDVKMKFTQDGMDNAYWEVLK